MACRYLLRLNSPFPSSFKEATIYQKSANVFVPETARTLRRRHCWKSRRCEDDMSRSNHDENKHMLVVKLAIVTRDSKLLTRSRCA